MYCGLWPRFSMTFQKIWIDDYRYSRFGVDPQITKPRSEHFRITQPRDLRKVIDRGLRNGVHRNGVPERRSNGRNGAGTPFITSARDGNGNGVPKFQERLKERPFSFLGGCSISRGEYFARKLKLEPNGRQKQSTY